MAHKHQHLYDHGWIKLLDRYGIKYEQQDDTVILQLDKTRAIPEELIDALGQQGLHIINGEGHLRAKCVVVDEENCVICHKTMTEEEILEDHWPQCQHTARIPGFAGFLQCVKKEYPHHDHEFHVKAVLSMGLPENAGVH